MSKKKKKKLDEGMVMLSSMVPTGKKPTLSLRGDREDNFVFKGLPGQFDKDGNKILDEYGEPLKDGSGKGQSLNKNRGGCADDEEINEDSYHSGEIDKFIKDNEEYSEMSLPRLKLFGDKSNTKFLNVTYDALRQISKILKKMKI